MSVAGIASQGPAGAAMAAKTREALAELLLAMADDEFVIGYWDSEWTGIAPMLEEDVAFSSISQDEIGHARALYELLAELTDDNADRIAYGRAPEEFRHAHLLNHARGDWAFSIARRWLYDTADAVRLEALSRSSYAPLAQLVVKIRREETYHLMHMRAWMRRLAESGGPARDRLVDALARLWPDAMTVLAPLRGEATLVREGILVEPLGELRTRWLRDAAAALDELGLPAPPELEAGDPSTARRERTDDFRWLWTQFTMVARSEEGAMW